MIKSPILFISESSYWPLTDGKRQRTWALLEALKEKYLIDFLFIGSKNEFASLERVNTNIHSFLFVEVPEEEYLRQHILGTFKWTRNVVKFRFIKKSIENVLFNQSKNNYSFIFSRYSNPIYFLPKSIGRPIICDVDDVFHEIYISKIKSEKYLISKIKIIYHYLKQKYKVNRLYARIDLPIVTKLADVSYFKHRRHLCLPNLPFEYLFNQNRCTNDIIHKNTNIGFIGKLSYRPNHNGLIRFIKLVWCPLIQGGYTGRFFIAGSGTPDSELVDLIKQTSNIEFLGFIEKTEFFWSNISVLIVPVFEGGGSNIKIAEGLIRNKIVIGDSFAARGFEDFVEHGGFFICENASEWKEILMQMQSFSNESLAKYRKLVMKEKFSLNAWNKTLIDFVSITNNQVAFF